MSNGTKSQPSAATIRLGGAVYQMRPLDSSDVAELDQWLQARVISMARESLPPNASESDRRITMEAAIAFAMTVTWMSGHGLRMLATLDGMAQIVWHGIRHHHPEIVPAEIRTKLLDPKTLDEARQAFETANFRTGKPKGPAKSGKRRKSAAR